MLWRCYFDIDYAEITEEQQRENVTSLRVTNLATLPLDYDYVLLWFNVGRFLKTFTEGAATAESGSLFQYFTTLTENADPLIRRWLELWSSLNGCPRRPHRAGGRNCKAL